jgi:hypothetical protein
MMRNWITSAVGCVLVLLLILSGAGAVAGSASRVQAESDAGVSDEEYEIYSSIIKQFYVEAETKLIMIEERTFRYDFAVDDDEPWREKKKGVIIDDSAADDYEAKNGRQWLLNKNSFKLPVKINLITDLDLKAIFHGNWGELQWINYYRRFPDSRGFVMLSRIGFNTEHTQALLYVGSRCGRGCGDIHFLLLEKVNGAWVIKKELRKKSFG